MRWLIAILILWFLAGVVTELWMYDCSSNAPVYHDDLVVIGCKHKR